MWLLGACLLRLAERDPLAALFAGSVSTVPRSLGKLGDSKTWGEAATRSCYSAL